MDHSLIEYYVLMKQKKLELKDISANRYRLFVDLYDNEDIEKMINKYITKTDVYELLKSIMSLSSSEYTIRVVHNPWEDDLTEKDIKIMQSFLTELFPIFNVTYKNTKSEDRCWIDFILISYI